MGVTFTLLITKKYALILQKSCSASFAASFTVRNCRPHLAFRIRCDMWHLRLQRMSAVHKCEKPKGNVPDLLCTHSRTVVFVLVYQKLFFKVECASGTSAFSVHWWSKNSQSRDTTFGSLNWMKYNLRRVLRKTEAFWVQYTSVFVQNTREWNSFPRGRHSSWMTASLPGHNFSAPNY